MNNDYTHITMILDRSGSMGTIRSDVVGGFNAFLDEQKKVPGKCTVTLVQFDSENPYDVLRHMTQLADVKPLGEEYQPRSNTPLYDALGRGIVNTGIDLTALPEAERPGKVVFVIITDGLENASREYTSQKVGEMTKHQEEVYKWHFIYLGANQDAFAAGHGIGVQHANVSPYKTKNTMRAMQLTGGKVGEIRTSSSFEEAKIAASYTDEERLELDAD